MDRSQSSENIIWPLDQFNPLNSLIKQQISLNLRCLQDIGRTHFKIFGSYKMLEKTQTKGNTSPPVAVTQEIREYQTTKRASTTSFHTQKNRPHLKPNLKKKKKLPH
jgi:hypothetical protein